VPAACLSDIGSSLSVPAAILTELTVKLTVIFKSLKELPDGPTEPGVSHFKRAAGLTGTAASQTQLTVSLLTTM
jgi:hypothetical protein